MQFLTLYSPGQLSNSGSKTTTFDPIFRPFLKVIGDFFLDKYIVLGMYLRHKPPLDVKNTPKSSKMTLKVPKYGHEMASMLRFYLDMTGTSL